MRHKKKVFITGLGACCAAGDNLSEIWNAINSNKSCLPQEQTYLQNYLIGEVQDYSPQKYLLDKKLIKFISKPDVLGIYAARTAIENSNLINYRNLLSQEEQLQWNENTGVYVGSPGNKYNQQYDFLPILAQHGEDMKKFGEKIFSEVHPMWLLRILPNNVLAYTGINYGFKGPNHNIVNHAAGGFQALIEAYNAIINEEIDRAIVVAYDIAIEEQALFYYDKLGVLTKTKLLPLDIKQSGTILAEGAAAIVLESEASLLKRKGLALSEFIGGCCSSEAGNLFTVKEDGNPLYEVMSSVIYNNGLKTNNINAIVSHGNGNPLSDQSEIKAIHNLFGTTDIPVTGFKWAYGHTIVASGLLDTISAVLSLQNYTLPGIPNFTQLPNGLPKINVINNSKPLAKNDYILINNRGFGGMNASVVIRGC